MADVNVEKRMSGQEVQSSPRQGYGSLGYRNSPVPSPWRSRFESFLNNPFSMMRRFGDDMDQLFAHSAPGAQSGEFWPSIDVSEKDGKMIVRADLPGTDKNDVHVEVTDGSLTIRGERKREFEEDKGGYHHSERSYGSFYRSIPLPSGVKADEIKAQINNGVLEVAIPVPESQRARSIPIEENVEKKQSASQAASASARQSKAG